MTLFRFPIRLLTATLAVVALLFLILLFRMLPSPLRPSSQSGSPPIEVSVPALDSPEWQTVNWNPPYLLAGTGNPTVTQLQPPDVPMPPGDYCSYISQITGKPCVWHVQHTKFEDGSEFYDVELSSGDQILARGNTMRVHLSEMIEINKTYPASHGWLDYVEVAKWLERAGFGRLILQAIDHVLQREAGGGPVIKVFIDAAGWAARVVPPTADRFGEKVYVYLVSYGH